ncbi:MAG: ATP-binding protein [Solirubrobacteraceae bacterium]
MEVRCDPSAPGIVRHALLRQAGIGWMIGDLALVASELVTNAVRHSGAGPEDSLRVEVRFGDELAVLSVCDPGNAGEAALRARAEATFGGLGLHVVDQLAARWGSERDDDGCQRVWAEVPLSEDQ